MPLQAVVVTTKGPQRVREQVSDEIFALYAAITDPDVWRTVLRRLGVQLGATGMGVLFGEGTPARTIAAGIPPAEFDAIRDWLSALAQPEAGPDGASCHCAHQAVSGMTEVLGLPGSHCLAPLRCAGVTVGFADVYRERGASTSEAAMIESLRMLAPQLAQALALALRLAAAEASAKNCAQCSDLLPFGCVILDRSRAVLGMNGTAAEFLDTHDGLLVRENRLDAMRGADRDALRRALDDTLSQERTDFAASFFSVSRPSGRRRLAVFTRKIDAGRSPFALRMPSVRLVIVDTDRGSCVPREVVQALYELTETESRVAWHLSIGDTLEQTAERLGIAHNTLRHHLERIFAKMEIHRQSDLIRLVHAPFVSISGIA